jgi:hypothetical protein
MLLREDRRTKGAWHRGVRVAVENLQHRGHPSTWLRAGPGSQGRACFVFVMVCAVAVGLG